MGRGTGKQKRVKVQSRIRIKLEPLRKEETIHHAPAHVWRLPGGYIHRIGGAAIEYFNGDKCYYEHGKRHREDGPAVEYVDGREEWWQDGKLHRGDGPAVVYPDGRKYWWRHGKRHRGDGPAREDADGYKAYYLNGEELSEEEYKKIAWKQNWRNRNPLKHAEQETFGLLD